MQVNRWDDAAIDTTLYLLLEDLTSVLSRRPDFQFAYKNGSFIDLGQKEITGSSFWDVVDPDVRRSGYKTDVFLRTMGTMRESSLPELQAFFKETTNSKLSHFAAQLLALLEDIRLEALIRKRRPGTIKDFQIRTRAKKHYFSTQLRTNVTRGYPLDEVFCMIFLLLHADGPEPHFPQATESSLGQLERLKPLLYDSFAAQTTRDVRHVTERIVVALEKNFADMMNTYITFPIKHVGAFTEDTLFDELTRTDPLGNDDSEEVDEDNQERFETSFPAWHRENENSDRKQNMLQMELDVGTKTNITGGDARETDEGDAAMGTMHGSSGESDKNDYSETGTLAERKAGTGERKDENQAPHGTENKYAVEKQKERESPTEADQKRYQQFAEEVEPLRRRLAATIEKTLEHKRNAPRRELLMGRLSKKLLPLVLDENPRVFYKKSEESRELDAVFTLLVDCSASMHDKMDETKRGIVLFHEVLDRLKIPHSIVGFWEDANEGRNQYHPNYFHRVHTFEDSPYSNTGAYIMQLEPEEDNRDGFSIRVATERLMKRDEKNKFLLVFTDGEPSAMNYAQNGIVDTNVAVAEARKKGVDVMGMFLSDGEITEHEDDTMKNIYGNRRVMVPSVSELPEMFVPLLKKLLLQGM